MAEDAKTRDTLPDDENVDVERKVVSMTEELSNRHPKLEPAHYKSEHERESTFPEQVKFADKDSDDALKMKHNRGRRESGADRASERGKAAVDTMGMADTLNEGEAMLEDQKRVMGATQRKTEAPKAV